MNHDELIQLAERLISGEIATQDFLRLAASEISYTSALDHTSVDLDRPHRCGFPEVIYGEGKSAAMIVDIAAKLLEHGHRVLATRVEQEKADAILKLLPGMRYNNQARTVRLDPADSVSSRSKTPCIESKSLVGHVAVISAGTSDRPVAEEARETLDWMGVGTTMIRDVEIGRASCRERV